jgi:hypothetical protein
MPAPFPPNDNAIIRFRYTKQQPAPEPIAPPPGSPPGTPAIIRAAIGPGHEDTELFELHPPTGDIAEVERQWKNANPPDSGKEWQDAFFPGPEANPPQPMPPKQLPDVDAQGLRHRAAGQEELPGAVTEGVAVPGRGVGFAEGQDESAETYGDENLSLAQLEGQSDEQILEHPGIGEATLHKIKLARNKRDRAASKK